MQVVEEPVRRVVLLDLVLSNKGLVVDVKARGSLGCSDHEIEEFRILSGRNKAVSRIATLDFKRANFVLQALEGKGAQKYWLTLKRHFLQARDWCIPENKKPTKNVRRPAWTS